MQFRPIRLSDREYILSVQDRSKIPLSDFNFTNLWIWRFAREIAIAEIEGCLMIRTTYPNQEPYYFFPMGSNASEAFLAFLAANPLARFRSLSPSQAQFIQDHTTLTPLPNRDRFDYVYSIPELIALNGRKYHKKKNHLNKFFNSYPHFIFEEIESSHLEEVREVYQRWYEANLAKDEALDAEKRGIESILEDFVSLSRATDRGLFGLRGGLLRIDGEIVAFSFSEAISSQSIVVHIEKANIAYAGAFQAINQQCLANLWGDFLWANREEDLGIEGLRKAKLSYQPIHLLEKYEV
ncbi:DUF2156 domain-containing protein [Helicobacter pametensis]|uniref:DUF2156 domain-containing protein n=1 Tax=Helicobacter pametensis TaxID=95149 RepID=UPI0004B3E81D|nr:phosphatidylglycerol lysyltransferase domain-containing protein [Helicobacter pametensis]